MDSEAGGGIGDANTCSEHRGAETMESVRGTLDHYHTLEHSKMGPTHPDYQSTTILFTEGISSVGGGIFNYANTYVGAGIIGIPLASKTSDWLVMSGFKTCRHNYDSLMEHLFGKVGIYTYFLFTFLYAYGADVAYIIIMSTNITAVINGIGASDAKAGFADDSIRRIVVACMAVFFVLPLALYRDMHSLRFTSFISIVANAIVMVVIIAYSPIVAKDANGNGFNEDVSFAANKDRIKIFVGPHSLIFVGLSQIIFAYIGQHAAFEVLKSLQKPSLTNWLKVSFGAVGIALVLFTMLGSAGYLSFGELVNANILETFPSDDIIIGMSRGLFSAAMVFSYPMNQFMARLCLDRAIFVKGLKQGDYPSLFRHLVITLSIWGSIVVIVMFTDDLSFVLSLTGAVSGSTIGYILPPLAYFVTFKANFATTWKDSKLQFMLDIVVPATCLIFGSVALVVGTITTFTSHS